MLVDEIELESYLKQLDEQPDHRHVRREPGLPEFRHSGLRGRVVYGPAGRPRVKLLSAELVPEREECRA